MSAEMTVLTNVVGRRYSSAVTLLFVGTLFVSSQSQQGSTCSFNIIAGEGNITTSDCSRMNSCTSQCRWNISSTMAENVITLSFFEDPDQGETPVEITFEDGCGEVPLREATYYGNGLLLSYPVRPNDTMKMQSKSRCIIVTMNVRGVEDARGIVVNYKEGKLLEDGFLRVENGHVITAHDHLGLDITRSDYVLYRDNEANITAMALHLWDKMLYIADDVTNTIRRYEVEAFDRPIRHVANIVTRGLGEVTSLAVDPSSGTVYWTDGVLNTISSVNHDGTSRRDVITTGLQYPNNLVLDHLQQTLYWTCNGVNKSTVESASTDGSNRKKVVIEDGGPILIALEFQHTGSQVYWINTAAGNYGTIIGERSGPHYVSEAFKSAAGFSVFSKYWYWTKAGEPYLYITKADEDWFLSLLPFYNMNIMLHYQTPELDATAKAQVLMPFGRDKGDQILPPSDEGTSPPIYLSEGLVFFGRRFYRLYVNTNGVVSLNEGSPTFHPTSFPFSLPEEDGEAILIAPFYVNVDTIGPNGGTIYYRTETRGNHNDYLFRRLERMIYADFFEYYSFNETNFEADFMFIVTWDSVSYFSEIEKATHTNTFQAMLLSNGVDTYAVFNYEDINWSTGASSRSRGHVDRTRKYGETAKVGFNLGDGQLGFMLNASGTDILNMDERSNIGIPGRWIFKIDGLEVEAPDEDVNVRCLEDWTYFDVEFACFKFIPYHLNWTTADQRCKKDGGVLSHLATITSQEKNDFIAGEITGGAQTWVGGLRDPFNELEWTWITGEPWVYQNWRQREPNNKGKAEHCLNTNFVRPGLWNDHFCHNKKASICETFPIVDNFIPGGDSV